ncbi:MAG TPA: hypothetical protein P5026_08755 [Kiritimatiellia bacterium]|nr:hypothetical protein [Kiritimatiellia bacterium]HRU70283.1 hypothetical protein [Kiritimatiellia bacterium]
MRALKRWWRRRRAWRAAQPRLEANYRAAAERLFGGPVTWRTAGGRGRDVVCQILCAGNPVGYLRMVVPTCAPSAPASNGLPFISLPSEEKLAREWRAYALGAPLGLTPQPLWRDAQGMISGYRDARPLEEEARRSGRSRLALATEALSAIARLHAAGVTHMDMSLANILRDRASGTLLFVDFEYGAAPGLSVEQQCLYDYLRLLESIWKFLPDDERAAAVGMWGEAYKNHAPATVRAADLTPLRPALGRVLAAPELAPLFQS